MNATVLIAYASKITLREGVPVTPQDAEREIHTLIDGVCKILGNTQEFGYHEPEDIYQFAYLEALKVLETDKYDAAKPLENYLYTHLKNRISNLKRAQYFRYEAPCKCCDAFNPGPEPCRRWHNWYKANTTKQQLMRPVSLGGDDSLPAPPDDPSDRAVMNELDDYITARLEPELLDDYQLLKDERDIPRCRRTRLRDSLRAILEGSPFDPGGIPCPSS